jgi:hypothetical protein
VVAQAILPVWVSPLWGWRRAQPRHVG